MQCKTAANIRFAAMLADVQAIGRRFANQQQSPADGTQMNLSTFSEH
jgi:hypothetical protein